MGIDVFCAHISGLLKLWLLGHILFHTVLPRFVPLSYLPLVVARTQRVLPRRKVLLVQRALG